MGGGLFVFVLVFVAEEPEGSEEPGPIPLGWAIFFGAATSTPPLSSTQPGPARSSNANRAHPSQERGGARRLGPKSVRAAAGRELFELPMLSINRVRMKGMPQLRDKPSVSELYRHSHDKNR